MKPGAGKAKGNSFEGQIAKKLSAALQPLNFIRTPGSGARVGGKNFATIGQMFGEDALKIFVGDVVPINERDTGITFKYSVECKFYKTPDNFPALVTGNANFFKWFEESATDAVKINKEPMLIFKWNRTPTFVAIDARNMTIAPRFQIIQGPEQRHLAVYDLDDLLPHKDFWLK